MNRNSRQNQGGVYKTKKPMLSMWRDQTSDQAVPGKIIRKPQNSKFRKNSIENPFTRIKIGLLVKLALYK